MKMVRGTVIDGLVCVTLMTFLTLVSFAGVAISPHAGGLMIVDVQSHIEDTDGDGFEDTVVTDLTVYNANNIATSVAYVIQYLNRSTGQFVDDDLSNMAVPPLESKVLQVMTTTSILSPNGLNHYLSMEVLRDEQGDYMDSVSRSVWLFPKGDYKPNVTTPDKTMSDDPGESVRYKLSVLSRSNNNDTIILSLTSGKMWGYDLEMTSLFLMPKERKDVNLTIHIPPGLSPGDEEKETVRAQSSKDPTSSDYLHLTTTVAMRTFDLELTTFTPRIVMPLGEKAVFNVSVANLGSYEETVLFSISSPISGWGNVIDKDNMRIPGLSFAILKVTVTVPPWFIDMREMVTTITAWDPANTTRQYISLTTAIALPDLTIKPSDILVEPEVPGPQDPIYVTVNVRNVGYVNAYDVVVMVEVDDQDANLTLPVQSGSTNDYLFSFEVPMGTHTIKVLVDPENDIEEFDDTNNTVSLTVVIHAAELGVAREDVVFYPEEPMNMDEVDITITVRNAGTVNATGFYVELLCDGVSLGIESVINISKGGGEIDLVFLWDAVAGNHTFEVKVDPGEVVDEPDELNNVLTFPFYINIEPEAAITMTTVSPVAEEPVTFDASGSYDSDGEVTSYFFAFGDGDTSGWISTPVVTHVYPREGVFTVTLSVRDDSGCLCSTDALLIVNVGEGNLPPSAAFEIGGKKQVGKEVSFDASTSDDPEGEMREYLFDFGDGTDSGWVSSPKVSHSYNITGTFTVTLTVKDDKGKTGSTTMDVKIGHAESSPGFGVVTLAVAATLALVMVSRRRWPQ